MPVRLNAAEVDFEARFRALLDARQGAADAVDATVGAIVDDVRRTGDKALLSYTERFDRVRLTAEALAVDPVEIDVAASSVPVETRQALALARDRIEAHHRRQLPADDRYTDAIGVELGSRWTPLDSAGLYVPGGTAAYPSSVLMNAMPARVAGVKRLVMVVPAPDGKLNPLVLVAARLAGIDEIYRVGGAQAVAALAYGTATIAPVDKIVGPGNAYVAAAKRRVFGKVGIDMIAGPSEVLVVADDDNDPAWVAADLLAQAEHDPMAQAILITISSGLADRVAEAVEGQLRTLPRAAIAGDSWRNHGALIVAPTLEAAMELSNRVAPEHLELAVADPEALLPLVRNAGAVFLGHYTPEAIGDYVGGSNHVLPTNGAARFSSGLSVLDFMKRISLLKCGPEQLRALGPAAMTLADAEGLAAHGRSVSIRVNR